MLSPSTTMPISPATGQQRLRYLLVNALAFLLCYPSTNWHAKRLGVSRHLTMAWETQIPFLPWMILPYMSSGLLLLLCFAQAPRLEDVRLLAQRLLLATVLAGLVFVAYPLQFSVPRPALESSAWSGWFGLLASVDQPYNQLPSLHVAYCCILSASWSRWVRNWTVRGVVLSGLALVAISTLFTYQHHALDVLGGAALGWICVRAVHGQPSAPRVAFYYAMGAGVWLITATVWLPWWLAGYGTASLLLVARAYAVRDAEFLRKRGGGYPIRTWLLYAPYLVGYWLTWLAVQHRERDRPAFHAMAPHLWVGRRLSAQQAMRLPPDCTVIDLANELPETSALRTHRYHSFAMLDLLAPDDAVVQAVVQTLRQEIQLGHSVYLHCAMGYARGQHLARAYLALPPVAQPLPSPA